MRLTVLLTLVSTTACAVVRSPPPTSAARNAPTAGDTAAIRSVAAAHYASPPNAVAPWVTIRADTAWAEVRHARSTSTVVRLERRNGRWRFVREVAHGIS